eukprot:scaffold6045_cov77-Skeletonema_marinoi.AAC.11
MSDERNRDAMRWTEWPSTILIVVEVETSALDDFRRLNDAIVRSIKVYNAIACRWCRNVMCLLVTVKVAALNSVLHTVCGDFSHGGRREWSGAALLPHHLTCLWETVKDQDNCSSSDEILEGSARSKWAC